ncbi:MAG: hypothetical protein ACR2O1_12615 [Boseongicola sp.]
MVEHTDTFMILGILVFAAAFPAAVGAFSRGDPPRAAIIAFVIGGVMIVFAQTSRPGGYSIDEIPRLFMSVFTGP